MDTGSKRMTQYLARRRLLGGMAATATLATVSAARAQSAFTASPALIEAARKEGKMTIYTANFAEVIADMIKAFNKRFPFVRIDMVRAPGGQLFTRVQTEAAAGKLIADVVDHTDRGLMVGIADLFADYTPPNAKDFLPSALVSPKFWPTAAPGWCIAWHTELMKNPPKTWMDLTKPEYGNGQIGLVVGPSGGTAWTFSMFQRQVLGEDFWVRQAATKPRLFPSGAPQADALVRGEINIAPALYSIVFPKKRDGAPIDTLFPPEGVPITPHAAGIPKSAANPNAARLFLDWFLSTEGQALMIRDQGTLSALKDWPATLPGFDPKVNKVWLPEFRQYQELNKPWLEEWNRIYGYRQ
jgi:iron(III) transport system substrate-binding protein